MFFFHSTLGLRAIKKKKDDETTCAGRGIIPAKYLDSLNLHNSSGGEHHRKRVRGREGEREKGREGERGGGRGGEGERGREGERTTGGEGEKQREGERERGREGERERG